MFTKEIEEALEEGRVDLAVHSLKDLPTTLAGPFEIAAITERVDPRDAFLSIDYDSVHALPLGARVGTSSLRRQAQLKQFRPDLEIFPLRGNVDTRVRKLEEGAYDAVILAAAGLKRLGKTQHIKEILDPEIMCSAAGQGALGIEIRLGDAKMRATLAFLNHEPSRLATVCERALLNQLGGGCQVPIGAYAVAANGEIKLTAICARPDGSQLLRESGRGTDPVELGQRIGKLLLGRGGDRILQDVANENAASTTPS
jgi:hydroxymethylbilane synthase